MEIQFWGGKWIGEDFYFIMETQKKNTPEDARPPNSHIQQNKQHSSYPDELNLIIRLC